MIRSSMIRRELFFGMAFLATVVGSPASLRAEEPTKPNPKKDETPPLIEPPVRHVNISFGLGAGVVSTHDAQSGDKTRAMASVDATSYGTLLGRYGVTHYQLDIGKPDGNINYVALSTSGMGGYQVIGRKGHWKVGSLHLGVEPLNVAARGTTTLVSHEASTLYKSEAESKTQQATALGVSQENIDSKKQEALSQVRSYGIPLDDNGNVPHTVNYFEVVPSVSVGLEKTICSTGNALAVVRGGIAEGTLGKERDLGKVAKNLKAPVPTYGAGLYLDCGVFRSALEFTHYAAAKDATDTAELNASVKVAKILAIGVNAQAIHEGTKSSALPSFSADDGVTGTQAVLTARLTTK